MKRRFVSLVLAALVLSMPGCGEDKKKIVTPVLPPPYPVLSTPQKVLVALEMAYANRDSTKYLTLFDAAYSGASYDASPAPGPQPGAISLAQEARHIKAIAENPNVLRVDIDLGSEVIWNRTTVSSDDGLEEWAQIIVLNPRIGVYQNTGDSEEAGRDLVHYYKFRSTTPAASPTDTLWSIVRWIEDGPPPP